MSSTGVSSVTETVTNQEETKEEVKKEQVLVLRLKKKVYPHVTWGDDVIDNEHLGRLKSNCCCIYVPPRDFDDPSTYQVDEQETEHCRGHSLPPPCCPHDNSPNPTPSST